MGLTWSMATPCLAQPYGLRAGCRCVHLSPALQTPAPCRRGVQAVLEWTPLSLHLLGLRAALDAGLGTGGGGMLARQRWKTSPGWQPGTVGGSDLSGGCASPYFPFPN